MDMTQMGHGAKKCPGANFSGRGSEQFGLSRLALLSFGLAIRPSF
jgi:hypothetical protein